MPLEVKDLSVFLASGEVVTEHVFFQIENRKNAFDCRKFRRWKNYNL